MMSLLKGVRRVVCGVSGGVDSAVAAGILKGKGFDVVGVFMKNWDDQDEDGTCGITQENDYQDAKLSCNHLGIPFVEVSFVKDYWNEVFSRLVEDYEKGFTPNPDILCNRYIKFGSFYKYAREQLGADAIATGHYAQNSFGNFLERASSFPGEMAELRKAVDATKDQTLFLSDICQEPLQRTMFPLGQLYKTVVRQMASDMGLSKISTKRDSTGICFIGDRRFSNFISKYIEDKPGDFVDVDTGKNIGTHNGVHQFTIGQRCRIPGSPKPYYVCSRDPKSQVILAGAGRDHPALYSSNVLVTVPHWIGHSPDFYSRAFSCMFKFQHTEWNVPCWLYGNPDSQFANVHLAVPTRAITPGQQAVFYKGDVCLGSAKILNSDLLVQLNNVMLHGNFFNRSSSSSSSSSISCVG